MSTALDCNIKNNKQIQQIQEIINTANKRILEFTANLYDCEDCQDCTEGEVKYYKMQLQCWLDIYKEAKSLLKE